MKTACLFLCAVFCLTAADLAGTWRLNIVAFGEEVSPAKLDLKVEGKKLSGTLNELTVEGTAEDDSVKFSATRPNGAVSELWKDGWWGTN
jgi:hypothetical protein